MINYNGNLNLMDNFCFIYRYWQPTYEDSLNLIAQLPEVAAFIYRR
jgi:hypothetical protein